MAAGNAAVSGFSKFLNPNRLPHATDIQAAVLWGVAAGTTALYFVQPFDWIKKTFFEKPEPEGK